MENAYLPSPLDRALHKFKETCAHSYRAVARFFDANFSEQLYAHKPQKYLIALLTVFVAVAVKYIFDPYIGREIPLLLLFASIMFSAWYGGVGPGLTSVVISGAAVGYYFTWDVSVSGAQNGLRTVLYLMESTVIMLMCVSVRSFSEKLARSELRFRTLFENSNDGIVLLDKSGIVQYCSPSMRTMLGYDPEEIVGQTGAAILAADQTINIENTFSGLLDRDDTAIDAVLRVMHKDGAVRWVESTSRNLLNNPAVKAIVVNFRDITELKKRRHATEEILRYQTEHDILTGLPNRKALMLRLEEAIAEAKEKHSSLAVMYLDLDRFKSVNDSLGHEIGDQFLQRIARKLKSAMREDDAVARLGGDEFIILANGVGTADGAAQIAYKVLKRLQPMTQIENFNIHVSASIGVALYPFDGTDAQTLLKNADAAQFRAKESGRNQFKLYSQTMNLKAADRLLLESSLRLAAQRDELVLAYQPIIEMKEGRPVAVEALVRWNHQRLGTLFPNEFIPLAEETGSILSIGNWVLKAACHAIQEWPKDTFGESPIVTINLSAMQFWQPHLVQDLAQLLHETGVNPKKIQLEITESVAMREIEQTIQKLTDLNDMGVQIVIDDFGTGYSSLSYLKRFPIHKIKIDQSFVKNCINDPQDAAIIKAIISMAHSMKLEVIAEGVETEEQLALLTGLDCDYIQGFLISQPMAISELGNWIEDYAGITLPATIQQ